MAIDYVYALAEWLAADPYTTEFGLGATSTLLGAIQAFLGS
ncbi:hypothetical protein PENANT_c101G10659 [Penicillium antarcticum]|uniref:Uncharacterized protein n=1 Tax=Penicillium antarcticum TaxID=416450 RepID=A0A1V6PMM5_9EURO|nr:hypothetical protein PENANT_c101G10659 [Penicillium antarcticum]